MESKIFRKTALDKISSPEQLNEYMKVAGPGVWCIMAALAVTFAAFFIWGVLGSIPETTDISGTALIIEEKPMAVYCFLPIADAAGLAAGMDVRVSPSWAPREQYGYMYGMIESIGETPVSAESLAAQLGENIEFVYLPAGNVVELVVALAVEGRGTPRWSTPAGAALDVPVGSTCMLTVVTAERKPYELMFR